MSVTQSVPASQPGKPVDVRDRVIALLVEYLHESAPVGWPGTDGLSLAEVVEVAYPAAVAAGRVPGLEHLLEQHPELAETIAQFLRPAVTTQGALP